MSPNGKDLEAQAFSLGVLKCIRIDLSYPVNKTEVKLQCAKNA